MRQSLATAILMASILQGSILSAAEQEPKMAAPPPISSAEQKLIPPWFLTDDSDNQSLFDAWRKLETPGASMFWQKGWKVIAGVVCYEDGSPAVNCPLDAEYFTAQRGYTVWMTTDKNGYFIIYGVPENEFKEDFSNEKQSDRLSSPLSFYASPGYPFSWQGRRYADSKDDRKKCKIKILADLPDRKFCLLTCKKENGFDPQEFEVVKKQQLENFRKEKIPSWRATPHSREDALEDGIRNVYRMKIVTPEGEGIPNALLMFSNSVGAHDNRQTVATDEKGYATLIEDLRKDEKPEYYRSIKRELTIDAPGYGVGPISNTDLKTESLNVITARTPATISGRVIDWNGNGISASLRIVYERRNSSVFELNIPAGPDGSFTFNRIMPGEKFRIVREFGSHQFASPMGCATTDFMTLSEAEKKEGIVLQLPLATAVCGIVVDENDKPVTTIWNLSFLMRDGGWGYSNPTSARFGMGLGVSSAGPLQIEVGAKGFKPYLSEKMLLAPGELRFTKVKLQREEKEKKN